MKNQIPRGFRDLLPEEVVAEKKVIDKIRAVFEKAGYERVITPTLEYVEALTPGLSNDLQKDAFKFYDGEGQPVMLRPEHTTPIARLVSTRNQNVAKPIRYFYSGDVFRNTQLNLGFPSQFHQMGLELIGVKGPAGDKEVIDLAIKALTAVGLKNVQVTVGDVGKISKKTKKEQAYLLNQDFVSLKSLPKKEDLVASNHDYYTGMIFQIYVPELGYVIGSGGRYDDLLGKFGQSRPAVGFAFSLNRVLMALEAQS